MTSPLPKKLDVLRPPLVWNFPIERVIDMKNALLLKEKNETAKIEIRKVAPTSAIKIIALNVLWSYSICFTKTQLITRRKKETHESIHLLKY